MNATDQGEEEVPGQPDGGRGGGYRQYEQLVTAYTRQLGPPAYSGTYDPDDAGYPESEAAGDLTAWLVGGNRLHLLYAQQDPELPVEITVACYPAIDVEP